MGHGEYNLRIFGGLVFELIYFTKRLRTFLFSFMGKGNQDQWLQKL